MSDQVTGQDEKREKLDELLTQDHLMVHLDPSLSGVELPESLTAQDTVSLKLSRLFRGALALDEGEVVAELLFHGHYFICRIPYKAIWGATSASGESIIWPQDTPPKILTSLLQQQASPSQKSSATPGTGKDNKAPEEGNTKKKSLAQKGHLRRIK